MKLNERDVALSKLGPAEPLTQPQRPPSATAFCPQFAFHLWMETKPHTDKFPAFLKPSSREAAKSRMRRAHTLMCEFISCPSSNALQTARATRKEDERPPKVKNFWRMESGRILENDFAAWRNRNLRIPGKKRPM